MKRIFSIFVSILCIFWCGNFISAESVHPSYEYSADNYNDKITSSETQGNAKVTPDAFSYKFSLNDRSVSGLGIPFNSPSDFLCDQEGNVIVADAGNGRIVIIDYKLKSVIAVYNSWKFSEGLNGDFSPVSGIFVKSDTLYICMQNSGTILVTDYKINGKYVTGGELGVKTLIDSPDLSSVTDNFNFRPKTLTVDNSGRMYVIVQGVYDGLVMLETDGKFLGYIGANKIKISLWERFWRSISTTEQIEASLDTVPIEFYAMDIDGDGFIYTTSKGNEEENVVRRLNMVGNDVLKNSARFIKGDLSVLVKEGDPGTDSNLIDIDVADSGIYTCLDNARGRIFTYDNDGNMLFAFGGLSARKGGFSVPGAVCWRIDEILVLDKGAGEIVCFEPTVYGKTVLNAAKTQYSGKYGESFEYWNEVLKLNPNNEIANLNVGKLEYNKENYKTAMKYFKLANDRELYSKAYSKYRSEIMIKVIPFAVIGIIILIIIFSLLRFRKHLKDSSTKLKSFLISVKKKQ